MREFIERIVVHERSEPWKKKNKKPRGYCLGTENWIV
ncbi:hypothetical protein [Desulfotomaculum sp. 1211_IL3151]